MGKKAFYSTMFIAIFAMIFVRGAYAGIGISPTTMNLKVGETATLTIKPDTLTTGYGIKSLNRSIATVNPPDGVGTASFTVTAVAPGTTKIQILRLISGSYVVTAECAVTVTEAQTEVWPQSATLSPARITLREGEEASIEAAVLPANYNQGTPQWSVENQNIASVTGSGLTATVKGLAVGTTTLHFTIGNANVSCVITVESADIWPESATLSPARLTLKVGEQASVDATVRPDNYNQGSLKWSIDDERTANVTPNGLSATVEAVAAGTTTLHFTVGNANASCVITVTKAQTEVWPESATLSPARLTLKIGEQTNIKANVLPADFNQGTPQWRINHEELVHVTPNGLFATVKGLVAGTTTLFFTVGNASAKCVITVTKTDEPQPGELKAIVIVPESIGLYAGDRGKFHVKAVPEGATLPALSWKVTEGTSIAKILRSDAGKCYIEGLRPGEAVLTVTAGKLKAEAMISVK